MKSLFTLMLFLTIQINSYAQKFEINYGANAGVTLTKMDDNYIITQQSGKIGNNFNLWIRGGRKLFLQTGVGLSNLNMSLKSSNGSSNTVTTDFSYQMINLPIQLGYKIVESGLGKANLRLMAGIQPTFGGQSNSGGALYMKEDFWSTLFIGKFGIGADLAFITIDLNINTTFDEFMKSTQSKMSYASFNLGFKL